MHDEGNPAGYWSGPSPDLFFVDFDMGQLPTPKEWDAWQLALIYDQCPLLFCLLYVIQSRIDTKVRQLKTLKNHEVRIIKLNKLFLFSCFRQTNTNVLRACNFRRIPWFPLYNWLGLALFSCGWGYSTCYFPGSDHVDWFLFGVWLE